jgi:hypothetical protein
VKSGVHVEESNQSNFTPWQFSKDDSTGPEREAKRVLSPLAERRGAMREAILPVPPRRTVLFEDADILI